MEDLNNVPSTGTFGNSINQVNQNFGLVKGAIENVEGRTIRSKGLFPTQAALTAAYPSPKVGDYAYVGSGLPATIYDCVVEGTWHNTGQTGGSETIDLSAYSTTAQMNTAIDNGLQGQVGYAECNTDGSTQRKDVVVNGFKLLASGGALHIKMKNANTHANATMNISPTSTIVAANTKPLFYNGMQASATNTWGANEIISVYYDGTNYQATNSQGGGGKAEKIKYDNSQSGLAANNVQGALDKVTDEIFGKTLGKYNSDNIATNYTSGIIKSTDGTIDTTRTAWRTSDFLELPQDVTTISVHGVFPYNSSLKLVGCYLYDSNKVKIGYPSGMPTRSQPASVTFSTSSYPTARYVRITEFTGGYTGDDCYITPVYVKGNRVSELEVEVEENENNIDSLSKNLSESIPFCFKGQYINTSGGIVNNTSAVNAYATDYISVQEGEVYEFANIGWNTPSLHHCWGYNDNKEPVSMLVGGYSLEVPFNGRITIPSGISYIKAWGNITINPSLTFLRASEIEEKIKKYEFDVIGSYIKNDGTFVYVNVTSPIRTSMIKVTEGDVLIGKDLFWGGESTLSQCWGYDGNGVPVQELVPCYPASNPFNGKITIPSGVSYICAFGRNSGNPTLYKTGSIYEDIDKAIANNIPKINYITVEQDGTNYNIIRTLLSTITDAAEDNQYVIIIPNGSYFECDLKGKKYVTLHGESKENTIIYCDGTSSNVTPSDYTIAADANKPLSSVNKNNKHIFHLAADLTIENCTLQSNDVKYCIHFENSAWAKAIIKDCIFIATNNHSAVGFGLRWAQHAEFHRCEFRVTGCTNAVYTHNWDWQKTTAEHIPISGGGVFVKFEGCKFVNNNQNLLTVGEIGSFNNDMVVFEKCKTTNPTIRVLVETTGSRTYHIKRDGTYETNPLLVPYCMHLDMINCGVENSITFNKSNRPDFENYCTIIS